MSGDVTLRSGSPHLVAAATSPSGLPGNKQTGFIHNSATHLTLTCHKILPLVQQGATPQGTSMQPASQGQEHPSSPACGVPVPGEREAIRGNWRIDNRPLDDIRFTEPDPAPPLRWG